MKSLVYIKEAGSRSEPYTTHEMNAPFSFPVSATDFIADQERRCGRTLTDGEREVTAEWVELVNRAYLDGLEAGDLAFMDKLIDSHSGSAPVVKFLTAAKLWMVRAAYERQRKHFGLLGSVEA